MPNCNFTLERADRRHKPPFWAEGVARPSYRVDVLAILGLEGTGGMG